MSDQEHESQVYEKMPSFTQDHIDWCVKALAALPIPTAVESFLATFDGFNDPRYGDEERIRKLIYDRLKDAKYRKDRPTRARILELKQALGDDMLDVIPFANQILLVGELLTLYYQEEKISTKLRILDKISQNVEKIRGSDGIPSSQHKSSHWAGNDIEFETDTPRGLIGTVHRNANELEKLKHQESLKRQESLKKGEDT